jgi:hypothetical protein
MILKKDNVCIFVLSLFFSIFILSIERLMNIGTDYHPDSLTYLNNSIPLSSFLQNPFNYLGSFYYVVTGLFNSEIIFLISFNIFIFSLTNLILFSKVRDIYSKNGLLFYFSVLIVIFDPYRAHLSVHVLKDTLIMFFLVLVFFTSNILLNFFFIFMGFMFRLGFFIYLPIIFLSSFKKIFLILFFIIFILNKDIIFLGLSSGQEINMAFRFFDIIPNFVDIRYPWGEILRAIFWSFIRLTGLAFVFHPIYFLFFFQAIAGIYLIFYDSHHIKKKLFISLIILASLAVVTTGYNSYLRWTQPLMTVLPILSAISTFKIIDRKIKV